MRHILRKSPIIIFVSLLVASILCPLDAGNSRQFASAASSVSPDGWGVVHSRPAHQWCGAVWGSSSSDIFAVGTSGTVVHFDGQTWSPMTSGTQQTLHDVWGSSGSDVWAVGNNGTILHYDGSVWSDLSVPGPNPPHLSGVWGSSSTDVFFVGSGGTIIHYTNGSTDWRTVGTGDLFGVWGSSSSDVYAVGSGGTMLHYDGNPGGIWTTINTATSVELDAVWGSSSSDIFAVGDYGTIVHYNTSTGVSLGSYGSWLLGVWGSSFYDVYAVGMYGTILHFDGNSSGIWTTMESGTGNHLFHVWGYYPDYDVYVVGAEGPTYTGVILHYPSPTISTVIPDQGIRGQTLEVSITGTRLDGVDDVSDVSFGSGITVNSLPLMYSTEIKANITISPGAALGPRDVSVSKSGDTYTLASAFEVAAPPPPPPTIASVNPSQGFQGQTLNVTITGTNLTGATTVSFGNGIAVNSFNPDSSTQISANISIGGAAALGARDVSVTTGGGTATKADGFTVVATPPPDTTPPAAITSLAATDATANSVALTWTAPGDDGNTGTASSYDIRYSTATISEANWGSADQCSGEPSPQPAGTAQTFPVTGLSPDTTYYFAMKTADEIPNWSDLSNVPSRKTEAVTPVNQPPVQPGNTAPTAGATGVSLTPTLSSSAFSDPDSGDTHAATQWQVDDTPWDYVSPAFDSGTDATNLTSISIPSGALTTSNLYWWRVRYQDNHGAWSDWSSETSFTAGEDNGLPFWIWIPIGLATVASAAIAFYFLRRRPAAN
jgi:hypothetical protein